MTQPTSQISTPNVAPESKATNTLGVVALILTIIGLLLTISVVGILFGIPLLLLGLLLGIIAVFKKPRGKAVTSIVIAVLAIGTLSYATYWLVDHLTQPVKEFSARVASESETNIEFRLVVKQPEFPNFFQQRLQDRLTQVDRTNIAEEYNTGSLALSFERYITFLFIEAQDEMFKAVNAWVEQYGIPVPETDMLDDREVGDTIEITEEDREGNA
jgi:hypothetical protein